LIKTNFCKKKPRGEAMMGMPAAIAGALRVELEESKQVGGAKSLIQ